MRLGDEALDGYAVRARAHAGLGRAREARRGAGAQERVLAAGQGRIAVVDGVHAGAQHLVDGHAPRAGAETIAAAVTAMRGAVHPRVGDAKVGFRSVKTKLVDKKKYPKPSGLFTIASLGGWTAVSTQFFTARTGLIAKAQTG